MANREIKLQARETIKKRAFVIIMTSVVFILLQYFVTYLCYELSGYNDYYNQVYDIAQATAKRIESATTVEEAERIIESITLPGLEAFRKSAFSSFLAVVMFFVGMLLTAGYQFHALMESRGIETHFRSIFYSFNHFWKILIINILTYIFAAIGFVLLIVPGLIIMLRYSMAIMVLYDNPELGPVQCMRQSARLMRGNKWRYFTLLLSFLMWLIASGFVSAIVGLPLLDVWVYPYYYISSAVFYSNLTVGSWNASYGQTGEN
ncbi:MAG: DUF975 family protein [Oscillospiraceae bacterium]